MVNQLPTRIPIGLCVYGIAYTAGFMGNGTPRANPKPLTAHQFLDLAAQLGLSSVETHLGYISAQEDEAALLAFRDRAQELGLQFVSAGPKIDVDAFRQHLPVAAKLGVKTVRCVISGILCGDRRPLGGLEGWQRHLAETAQKLKTIAPQAEDLGIRIGIENHQDATSADLIWLCEEVGSPNVGVVLDTGNPLAVAEDPVLFAERILPYLVHVHLKDYRMVSTESGYRLFHCAIGAGVVDFPALFRLFDTKPTVLRHIEMAALGERHIRILEPEYWAGLDPERRMSDMLPVLRRWRTCETEAEWQTPWETGNEAILPTWEMERLNESIDRMRQVLQLTQV
ncbi:sugar phosphate isomerase/epimerase [soil metagenome]